MLLPPTSGEQTAPCERESRMDSAVKRKRDLAGQQHVVGIPDLQRSCLASDAWR